MSVYASENPDWFRASIRSILDQTLPPSEFVLVCDGPLTPGLEAVVSFLADTAAGFLRLVRLDRNSGLGVALNEGLRHCSCEWVIRQDSDDLAFPGRCERQIAYAVQNGLDVASSWVEEFTDTPEKTTCRRTLPETQAEICRYARRRTPINHSCVLYRKSRVLAVGGYRDMPGFEDYDLWIRMLQNGAVMGNLQEPLLHMRAGEGMYKRRGGWGYCRDIARFWTEAARTGFVGHAECCGNILVRCAVSLMPNGMRQRFYHQRLRSK